MEELQKTIEDVRDITSILCEKGMHNWSDTLPYGGGTWCKWCNEKKELLED